MRISKENKKLLQIAAIAISSLVIAILISFYFFSKWEDKLIDEKKQICIYYANILSEEIEHRLSEEIFLQLFDDESLRLDSSHYIDAYLQELIEWHLRESNGMEGGVYFKDLDVFMGYAFPTSPLPIPVYGPPPRSHNIIRDQAIASIENKTELVDVHAFDPAVFPLATVPISFEEEPVGAVWVRIHIERELPVTRLKRIINIVTILSLFGFLVMAMFSFFLRNGIRNIRRELKNTRKDPGYRLKKRGGWFGFIPASINEMLDLLQKEDADRKELEKQLHQKEKMASLGRMVAGVAHEVRTPLSVVKTRIQMWEKIILANEEMKDKIDPDSIKLILNEIDRLSSLVKRLVIFSRLIYENLKPVDLDALIEEVLTMIDLNISGAKINIRKQLNMGSIKIIADANSIKQVLINILNNSIEAIEGEGEIIIKTSLSEHENKAVLELEDSGSGIPEEIIRKIYEPFFTTKESGAGLGLAISYEIIAAHNGTITFRNREQGGATCIIILPIK